MKAIVFTRPGIIEVQDIAVPVANEGWALIKVSLAGICGSDLTIYSGYHPRAKAPLVLGHEICGHLETDIPGMPVGTFVTVNPLLSCGHCDPCLSGNAHVCQTLKLIGIDCDGGMAEYVTAPIHQILPIPDGVSQRSAVFIEPIAVGVHSVREGGYVPGDNALVFGAGAIGLSVALTLKEMGSHDVTVCEPNRNRVDKAASLGFNAVQTHDNLLPELLELTDGKGFDFIFDCAGHQKVAELLPDLIKVRGKIIIVAGYKQPPSINFQKGMFKEFSIKFVRVYRQEDFKIACQLAKSQPLYAELVTHELPIEEAQHGFDLLLTPSDAIKVAFKFD
jgi:(R,R)-butanediol dehydrogenase/meso-butanediol dehydrogenase/diacetyl reductase